MQTLLVLLIVGFGLAVCVGFAWACNEWLTFTSRSRTLTLHQRYGQLSDVECHRCASLLIACVPLHDPTAGEYAEVAEVDRLYYCPSCYAHRIER